ncbi:orotate phosphoribosyltransferase [Candidatus Woesearchaeota archaeon]|nr:orotate phosphoribosyltransferase [Candidatus Woesearchaeota archaeon]
MENVSTRIADLLLDIRAVTLSPEKPFKFTSGILSPIYCDNRLIMSFPEKKDLIIDGFMSMIEEYDINVDVICGTATAGIPHAAFLAQKMNKPLIYVRKKSKTHGKENLVEGKFKTGKKVLVIEDHISTGGSSVEAVKAVRDKGGKVRYCMAITTYEMQEAVEKFTDIECNLLTLTSFTTLIEEARLKNYITDEEKEMILDWKNDPSGWGDKYDFKDKKDK